jgi:hypothetical protein
MALPISATPILVGYEAVRFLGKIQSDLKKPVNYKPTPNLGKARELIKAYAAKQQKAK